MRAEEGSRAPGTDLWIISGFLGSGKTSVLNALLRRCEDRRVGVVVNDFGTLDIDATLIEHSGRSSIISLNGGQIFCSCLSGSFVHALTDLAGFDLDAILVESSGLAKPGPMAGIVGEAVHQAEGVLRYRGMVGVVDAERVVKLRAVVNAVDEQLLHSDLILVNKIDLVDDSRIEAVKTSIRELCPETSIRTTTYGALTWDELPGQEPSADGVAGREPGVDLRSFAGWGTPGRPVAETVVLDRAVTRAELETALREMGEETFRIKGYVQAERGFWFVSVSGGQIDIRPVDKSAVAPALSIIAPASTDIPKLVRKSLPGAALARRDR